MQPVLDFLFLDANRLFVVPLVVISAILVLEVVMMVVGASLHGIIDDVLHIDKPHFDHDVHGFGMNFFNWINAGHVPVLLLVVAFLGWFGLTGLIIQWLVHGFMPGLLNPYIAGPISLLIALPAVRQTSKVIAALVPREHTTAVTLDSLVGRDAVVTIGSTSPDNPGQARVRDAFAELHYVRIIPRGENQLTVGKSVTLLERDRDYFIAREL